jgi:Immunoglobulin domain
VVNEGDNLRLQCAAVGLPIPTIVWEREDGQPIDWGKWKDNSKIGRSVNITSINRIHMGTYVCIADNGIAPSAKYKFQVDVYCEFLDFQCSMILIFNLQSSRWSG